jgi:hypothetical protein
MIEAGQFSASDLAGPTSVRSRQASGVPGANQRVRVWFGSHVVADYLADPTAAVRYASAMRQRFAGLQVTVDSATDHSTRSLPSERLWELIP